VYAKQTGKGAPTTEEKPAEAGLTETYLWAAAGVSITVILVVLALKWVLDKGA
jgi:hypothetical protein